MSADKNEKQKVEPRIHRYISEDFGVRLAAVDATDLVEHMRQVQNTLPLATVAGGRALIAASLMASHLKGRQEVTLDFSVRGPLERVYAQASHTGEVRVYVSQPEALGSVPIENLSLRKAMGVGLLTVSTFLSTHSRPQRGVVHLVSGEIGDDIAYYYRQSLQIPTAVTLGVHLDTYGRVDAAGGLLLELMPGAPAGIAEPLEKKVKENAGISAQLLEGRTIDQIVQQVAGHLHLRRLEHPHPLRYHCPCTKERVLRAISLLGMDEIERTIQAGESLDSQCQMCGLTYTISVEDLEQLRSDMRKQSMH